jgi:vacuolar-type H+-ATPase subunit I/STV1
MTALDLARTNRRRNGRAALAVLLGLVSLATVPAAVAYTHYANLELLKAEYAIPVAFLLGVAALSLAKRARVRSERTIGRVGGARTARLGRILGGLGVYVALTAALSVGVYELLNRLSG